MFIEGQEILDKRYKVIKKLGGGAFGEIFKGKYFALLTLLSRIVEKKKSNELLAAKVVSLFGWWQ